MSLLLDALNRASKDKAAAASLAAAQVQAAAGAPAATAAPAPELRLEPLLTPSATATPAPASVTVPGATTSSTPVLELSLSASDSAGASTSAPPTDPWHTEMEVAAPAPSQTPIPSAQPSAAAPAGAAPVGASATTSASVAKEVSAVPPATPAAAGAAGAPRAATRVAQEIVRAKAPGVRTRLPRRVMVLGAVALALGLGSVLWGWWGDPMAWFQTAGGRGPIAVVPGAADAPPGAQVALGTTSAPAAPETRMAPLAQAPGTEAADAAVPNLQAPEGAALPGATKAVRTAAADPSDPDAPGAAATQPDGVVPRDPCTTDASAPGCRAVAPLKPDAASKSASSAPVFQSRSADYSALEQGYGALVQGRLGEAAQAYGRALANNPQERDALLGLAYIAQRQGHDEEARGYYHQVLRHEPGNPVARAGLLTLSAPEDPQLAISRARDVAEQHPDSAAAQAALGAALARVGRLADAQLAFQRAHALEPKVAQHAFNLAVALDRLRHYAGARQYYERALALSAPVEANAANPVNGVPLAALQARLAQLRAAQAAAPTEPRP